jgi:hypothetical protein
MAIDTYAKSIQFKFKAFFSHKVEKLIYKNNM